MHIILLFLKFIYRLAKQQITFRHYNLHVASENYFLKIASNCQINNQNNKLLFLNYILDCANGCMQNLMPPNYNFMPCIKYKAGQQYRC